MRTRRGICGWLLLAASALLLVGTAASQESQASFEKIYYAAEPSDGAESEVFMMNPDGTEVVNLTEDITGTAANPRISPDGRYVAFQVRRDGGRTLWVMNPDGTGKREITFDLGEMPSVNDWIDGNWVLYHTSPANSNQEIRMVNIVTGDNRIFISRPFAGNWQIFCARVSPDRRKVMVAAQTGSNSPSQDLHLVDLVETADGYAWANDRVFFADPGENWIDDEGVWSRDGKKFYWNRRHEGGVAPPDIDFVWKYVEEPDYTGPSTIDGVLRNHDTWYANLDSVSPDGTMGIFHQFHAGELATIELEPPHAERIVRTAHKMSRADWGFVHLCEEKIAASMVGDDGQQDIFLMDPDGGNVRNLTLDLDLPASNPRFSPDGLYIAFQTGNPDTNVWVMNWDGSDKHQLTLLDEPYGPALNDWLDEEWIAYHDGPSAGVHSIRQLRLDRATGEITDKPLVESPFMGLPDVNNARVSPDRTKMFFPAQEGSNSPTLDLYLVDLVKTGEGYTFENGRVFYEDANNDHQDHTGAWSRDGMSIYWNRKNGSGTSSEHAVFVVKHLYSDEPGFEIVRPYDGFANLDQVSADGTKLLFHNNTGGELRTYDLATAKEDVIFSGVQSAQGDWGYVCDRCQGNEPPVADAGDDEIVTADCINEGACTEITLDGSASYDPDGAMLSYTWTGPGLLTTDGDVVRASVPVGVHTFTLTVSDGEDCDGTATDTVTITVEDIDPPSLSIVNDPVIAECTSPDGTPVDVVAGSGAVATDACDAEPVVTVSPDMGYPLGDTAVTLTATDAWANAADLQLTVRIEDTVSPSLSVPEPLTLDCNGFTEDGLAAVFGDDPQVASWLASATAADSCDLDPSLVHDGPGLFLPGSQAVVWTATDGSGNTAQSSSTVQVSYTFGGFLKPLLDDGSASIKQGKSGRTIPVKFRLFCDEITAGAAVATIEVFKLIDAETGDVDTTDMTQDSGASNDDGDRFRYDPDDGLYIYNLSTRGYDAPATYRIYVHLDDGTTKTVDFSLRK